MARAPVDRPTTLQTVTRALQLVELVASSTEPISVRTASQTLGINLTTTYHLFNTLKTAGYLRRDDGGHIRLGHRIGLLAEAFRRELGSSRSLESFIERLSERTRETAYLSLLQGDRLIVQHQVEAVQALRVAGHGVGFSGHEHRRASGRAVMAYLDDATCSRMLSRLLADTPVDQADQIEDRLRMEFATIRRQGWAVEHGEYQDGVTCTAAPLFDADNTVAGSVSVSVPTGRYQDLRDLVTREVLDTARAISDFRGHTPPQREDED